MKGPKQIPGDYCMEEDEIFLVEKDCLLRSDFVETMTAKMKGNDTQEKASLVKPTASPHRS
jgi:hypothetical protein